MPRLNLADCPTILNEQVVMLEKLIEYQFMANAALEVALRVDFTQLKLSVLHNLLRIQDHFAQESGKITEELLTVVLRAERL